MNRFWPSLNPWCAAPPDLTHEFKCFLESRTHKANIIPKTGKLPLTHGGLLLTAINDPNTRFNSPWAGEYHYFAQLHDQHGHLWQLLCLGSIKIQGGQSVEIRSELQFESQKGFLRIYRSQRNGSSSPQDARFLMSTIIPQRGHLVYVDRNQVLPIHTLQLPEETNACTYKPKISDWEFSPFYATPHK